MIDQNIRNEKKELECLDIKQELGGLEERREENMAWRIILRGSMCSTIFVTYYKKQVILFLIKRNISSILYQKSRLKWPKNDDFNSKFYHR